MARINRRENVEPTKPTLSVGSDDYAKYSSEPERPPSSREDRVGVLDPTGVPEPDLPAHRRRAKMGPKKDAVSFRFNAAQRRLLNIAVVRTDMTQQELLESLVWETLEERFGEFDTM